VSEAAKVHFGDVVRLERDLTGDSEQSKVHEVIARLHPVARVLESLDLASVEATAVSMATLTILPDETLVLHESLEKAKDWNRSHQSGSEPVVFNTASVAADADQRPIAFVHVFDIGGAGGAGWLAEIALAPDVCFEWSGSVLRRSTGPRARRFASLLRPEEDAFGNVDSGMQGSVPVRCLQSIMIVWHDFACVCVGGMCAELLSSS
jgi:hypothetical protein